MKKTLRTIKLGKAQELVAEVRFNDVNESADLDDPADWLGGWYEVGSGCLYVTNWQGALSTLDSAVDITNDWGNEPEERSERGATKRLLAKVLSLAPAAEVEEYQRKQRRFSQPTVPTQDSQEVVEEEHDSDRYYREQVEGDDDYGDSGLRTIYADQASAAGALAGISTQAWVDLAPHLSCSEAEVVKAFLTAWRDENTAEAFIQAHALADDDENDLHYQEDSNHD